MPLNTASGIGLKDLALRGKNPQYRDLGQWVAEAETENQPYMRLLVGCNLDDPCISLAKKQIQKSCVHMYLKSTLKQEKEDLKTLFKRDEKEDEENDLNKGNFEFLWSESDSLSIQTLLHEVVGPKKNDASNIPKQGV